MMCGVWRKMKRRTCTKTTLNKEELMRQPSKHYNRQHPAVGTIACPVCQSPKGVPCVTMGNRGAGERGLRTETHVGRVNKWERYAMPGEPGSVLPPSPVDTDNDCAP